MRKPAALCWINLNIAEMAKTVMKMNSGKITDIYENKTQKTAYEIGW